MDDADAERREDGRAISVVMVSFGCILRRWMHHTPVVLVQG